MKFIHLADLHLGRRLCGYPLIEDQRAILEQILNIIGEEKPQAVLIAGDVYDKLSPSPEAVALFDSFLTALSEQGLSTYIIAGNHDSAERIAFGARILDKGGIFVSPVYDGTTAHFIIEDEFGEVGIYLLPFIRVSDVRRFFPDKDIPDLETAVSIVIENMKLDTSRRNIILSHQFVSGGSTCDSERSAVGGTDGISADVYEDFDYAALGHLHAPQAVGSEKVRYGGTPLKYSASEASQKKSVTVCEMGRKGEPVKVTFRELSPLHDLKVLRDSFDALMQGGSDDYVQAVLTDEVRIPDAQKRLRAVYKNLLGITYEYEKQFRDIEIDEAESENFRNTSPLELFEDFFKRANNKNMSEEQRSFVTELIDSIWTEEV